MCIEQQQSVVLTRLLNKSRHSERIPLGGAWESVLVLDCHVSRLSWDPRNDRIRVLKRVQKMIFIYITLNNVDEARNIGRKILENKLSNCANWFPITCMYRWEGKIEEEPEMVLIVKTKRKHFPAVEEIVKKSINYTNCIAEIEIKNQRKEFLEWLDKEC